MRLGFLLEGLPGVRLLRDAEVSSIHYDSREVRTGGLFVAVPGFKFDGHQFVEDAVRKGASAVVAEREIPVPDGVGFAIVPDARLVLANVSARFYGYPSRDLLVVGITGTKGKTTTCHLVYSVLKQAKLAPGLIGTVRNIVGGRELPVKHTTPESRDLQDLLNDIRNSGSRAVAMEVSSHALALSRVEGLEVDVAVMTNIGRDHLDFHRTLDEYVSTKALLFSKYLGGKPKLGIGVEPFAVLNRDDQYFDFFEARCKSRVISYGQDSEALVRAENVRLLPDRSMFDLVYAGRRYPVTVNLPGVFNVSNSLAASSVGVGIGMDLEEIALGLGSLKGVPGRAEVVPNDRGFTIWVDYAHTPESLNDILSVARKVSDGKLIAVFGCGGDRDPGKRPMMGRIAASVADIVIITNDNPRTEDPEHILDQIEEGVREVTHRHFDFLRIPDRRTAIREALGMASPGDIVVIAGKGHETYQIVGTERFHFDDREEVRRVLDEER